MKKRETHSSVTLERMSEIHDLLSMARGHIVPETGPDGAFELETEYFVGVKLVLMLCMRFMQELAGESFLDSLDLSLPCNVPDVKPDECADEIYDEYYERILESMGDFSSSLVSFCQAGYKLAGFVDHELDTGFIPADQEVPLEEKAKKLVVEQLGKKYLEKVFPCMKSILKEEQNGIYVTDFCLLENERLGKLLANIPDGYSSPQTRLLNQVVSDMTWTVTRQIDSFRCDGVCGSGNDATFVVGYSIFYTEDTCEETGWFMLDPACVVFAQMASILIPRIEEELGKEGTRLCA